MISNKEKILIVDCEVGFQKVLESQFLVMGHSIVPASDGEQALSLYKKEAPILVILDILLPKLDGFKVCSEIRKDSDVPIILLAAFGDLIDKLVGFDLGVDVYFIKPFSFKELEVKLRTLLKRGKRNFFKVSLNDFDTISAGIIRVDTIRRQVYKYNKKIRLTSMEFSLLELLLINSRKVVSRFSILKELWGYKPERDIDTRVVDVHVSRLRSKLEHDPSNPDLILTVRGAGYFFQGLHINESLL